LDYEKLFAYGTLLDSRVQRELFGREVQVQPHTLTNYTTVANPDRYLSIVESEGESVIG
jgi:hypothetical protein